MNGANRLPTIQQAIDLASPGDVIYVEANVVYIENLAIDKGLTFKADIVFVAGPRGPYRIPLGSPAHDNCLAQDGLLDLDLCARPQNASSDAGAFESPPSFCP